MLSQYNQSYTSLLQTSEQAKLAKLATSTTILQTDFAIPALKPITKTTLNVIIAVILGLVGVIVIIIGKDILNDAVKNPEQLATSLKLPILGQILSFDAEGEKLITS